MMDKIFITNLRVQALIGVYPEERHDLQTLSIDLEMVTDFSHAIASDSVKNTINYAEVATQIIFWAKNSEFHLIESLAHFLVNQLFLTFPVQKVRLCLRKFTQEVLADSVGVIIERSRHTSIC